MFSTPSPKKYTVSVTLKLSSENAFTFVKIKILSYGKEPWRNIMKNSCDSPSKFL